MTKISMVFCLNKANAKTIEKRNRHDHKHDARKRALLFVYAGKRVHEIFAT